MKFLNYFLKGSRILNLLAILFFIFIIEVLIVFPPKINYPNQTIEQNKNQNIFTTSTPFSASSTPSESKKNKYSESQFLKLKNFFLRFYISKLPKKIIPETDQPINQSQLPVSTSSFDNFKSPSLPETPFPILKEDYTSIVFSENFSNDYYFDIKKTNLFWSWALTALIAPPNIDYKNITTFNLTPKIFYNTKNNFYLLSNNGKILTFDKFNNQFFIKNLNINFSGLKKFIVDEKENKIIILDSDYLYIFSFSSNLLKKEKLSSEKSWFACDKSEELCSLIEENKSIRKPNYLKTNIAGYTFDKIEIPYLYKNLKVIYNNFSNNFYLLTISEDGAKMVLFKLSKSQNFALEKYFEVNIKYFEPNFLELKNYNNNVIFGFWSDKPKTFILDTNSFSVKNYSQIFPVRLVENYNKSIIFDGNFAFSPYEVLKDKIALLKENIPDYIFLIPAIKKYNYFLLFAIQGKNHIYSICWNGFKGGSFFAISKDFMSFEKTKTNRLSVKKAYLNVFNMITNKAKIYLFFSNNGKDFTEVSDNNKEIAFKTKGNNFYWKIKVIANRNTYLTPVINLINFSIYTK